MRYLADTNWVLPAPILHRHLTPYLLISTRQPGVLIPTLYSMLFQATQKQATHLYGNVCDIEEIQNICRKHNLFLIEDASEAIGRLFAASKLVAMEIFLSFHFMEQNHAIGEGGVLVSRTAIYMKGPDTQQPRQSERRKPVLGRSLA